MAWERLWARGQNGFLDQCPGGNNPCRPLMTDDDRSLIENCCIKEAKQQWDLGHPPQKTERAVRVHVLFTLLMFALATAYRLQCEREARGGSRSAGNAGGASSWSRPGTRSSCLPKVITASFIWLSTPCCWVSSSKMSRQASAPTMTFSRSTGCRRRLERYVGISA